MRPLFGPIGLNFDMPSHKLRWFISGYCDGEPLFNYEIKPKQMPSPAMTQLSFAIEADIDGHAQTATYVLISLYDAYGNQMRVIWLYGLEFIRGAEVLVGEDYTETEWQINFKRMEFSESSTSRRLPRYEDGYVAICPVIGSAFKNGQEAKKHFLEGGEWLRRGSRVTVYNFDPRQKIELQWRWREASLFIGSRQEPEQLELLDDAGLNDLQKSLGNLKVWK